MCRITSYEINSNDQFCASENERICDFSNRPLENFDLETPRLEN